jgi:hypothetical protein
MGDMYDKEMGESIKIDLTAGKKWILRHWGASTAAETGIQELVNMGWIPHLMTGDANWGGVVVLFKRAE